jgi:hypothetical protein
MSVEASEKMVNKPSLIVEVCTDVGTAICLTALRDLRRTLVENAVVPEEEDLDLTQNDKMEDCEKEEAMDDILIWDWPDLV